jgi:hypothetical protein
MVGTGVAMGEELALILLFDTEDYPRKLHL